MLCKTLMRCHTKTKCFERRGSKNEKTTDASTQNTNHNKLHHTTTIDTITAHTSFSAQSTFNIPARVSELSANSIHFLSSHIVNTKHKQVFIIVDIVSNIFYNCFFALSTNFFNFRQVN